MTTTQKASGYWVTLERVCQFRKPPTPFGPPEYVRTECVHVSDDVADSEDRAEFWARYDDGTEAFFGRRTVALNVLSIVHTDQQPDRPAPPHTEWRKREEPGQ